MLQPFAVQKHKAEAAEKHSAGLAQQCRATQNENAKLKAQIKNDEKKASLCQTRSPESSHMHNSLLRHLGEAKLSLENSALRPLWS